MLRENLINIYEASFRENHTLPALTDYFKQESFTYLEMAPRSPSCTCSSTRRVFGRATGSR